MHTLCTKLITHFTYFHGTCPCSEFHVLTLKEVMESPEFGEALKEFPGLDTVTEQDIQRVVMNLCLQHDWIAAASRLFERDGDAIINSCVKASMHHVAALFAQAQATDSVLYAGLQSSLGTHFLFCAIIFTRVVLKRSLCPSDARM